MTSELEDDRVLPNRAGQHRLADAVNLTRNERNVLGASGQLGHADGSSVQIGLEPGVTADITHRSLADLERCAMKGVARHVGMSVDAIERHYLGQGGKLGEDAVAEAVMVSAYGTNVKN